MIFPSREMVTTCCEMIIPLFLREQKTSYGSAIGGAFL